jgi:hypothetical protein
LYIPIEALLWLARILLKVQREQLGEGDILEFVWDAFLNAFIGILDGKYKVTLLC